MLYKNLPKRTHSSPLIEYANYADGSHINLIKFNKPYSDGRCYAIAESTNNPNITSSVHKTYDLAKAKFDDMVIQQCRTSKILNSGITSNQ